MHLIEKYLPSLCNFSEIKEDCFEDECKKLDLNKEKIIEIAEKPGLQSLFNRYLEHKKDNPFLNDDLFDLEFLIYVSDALKKA